MDWLFLLFHDKKYQCKPAEGCTILGGAVASGPWFYLAQRPQSCSVGEACRVDQTTRSRPGTVWLCPLSLVSHNPACHGLQGGYPLLPFPPLFLPILMEEVEALETVALYP